MINSKITSELDYINFSLEEKSWYFKENYLQDELCDRLVETFVEGTHSGFFSKSKIGQGYKKNENDSVRNGLVRWVSDWDENSSIALLNNKFYEMMFSLSSYFRLSLKRFESQFSIYNRGGFYRCHLDQHQQSRHRQISSCLYLNDCEEGGELVLYKKGSKTEIAQIINPKKGSLVVFISGDIFHEVKLVCTSRYSISTWFRDDEILPFI